MKKRNIFYQTITFFTIISALFFTSCERDPNILEPADYPVDPEVFIDGFSSGLNYAAFGGSKVTAFDVVTDIKYKGTSSMRIEVPDFEDPQGAYAGGAYFTNVGRNLSGYDALTFWAKASQPANIDIVGIGNDLGQSKNLATITGLAVNSNWKKYIIPIPDPGRWTAERGMFFYSEGPENDKGYTIWFDEVQFEKLGTIAHPRPFILNGQDQTTIAAVGQTLNIGDIYVLYNMPDGTDERVNVSPTYFTFTSSDESVATVNESGQITVIAMGTAKVTAKFGSMDATGSITVNVEELPDPAPAPTVPAANVISLFSNAYTNVPVDTWATGWLYSTAVLTELQINGDDVKLYTNLNFNGIEFASQTIDATTMTHFHMDIWTPDPTNLPAAFNVLLVDFGADGVFGGGDDVSHEVTFTANTTPALATREWVQLDVPLSAFTGLTTREHLAQLVISGDPNTVYVDNVYFYKEDGGTVTEPTEPAPTPTFSAADVISLFSNPYTNVPVDTWSAVWDQADVADVQIEGNDTKLYTNLVFAGIEFINQTVDATSMTHFRMDIWTPDPTALPAIFKIKLVDFGADGAFGGGDDVEHELTFDANSSPPLVTSEWVSFDIPLSDFTGLTTRGHLAQMIISGDPNTIYVDNILFHK
ncbi:MAG: glycosyl hydrolase family 16 [Ignavibacteriaceae bacterium]|nr:glycosyl hydrolase family 16 [Ignavibacteriaceae bacterium]